MDADNIYDHFLQFIHLASGAKSRRSFMQLIWLLCAWVVWNERNNRMFNNVITPIPRLLDNVKMLSLAWLKAKKLLLCLLLNSGGLALSCVWV